jgi:hypothetical protein
VAVVAGVAAAAALRGFAPPPKNDLQHARGSE